EIGRQLDQCPEEAAGPFLVGAVGVDAIEKSFLKPGVFAEKLVGERIVRPLDRDRNLGQWGEIDVEIVLVDEGGDREEGAEDEGGQEARGFADRLVADFTIGVAASLLLLFRLLGRDEELAEAIAGDEGRPVVASEFLTEEGRESPEVGEERARVSAHEASG